MFTGLSTNFGSDQWISGPGNVQPAMVSARLIEQHGRDGKLTDWLTSITADCPKRRSVDMSDQCGAHYPDLPRVT
jgi:hypothetical protein